MDRCHRVSVFGDLVELVDELTAMEGGTMSDTPDPVAPDDEPTPDDEPAE